MRREEFFDLWSKLHGGAQIKGIVRAWLTISHFIARPIVLLRITPNTLSLLSIFAAITFLLLIDSNWAIALLVLSLLLDGIDGTVAILTGKSSRFGAMVDAVADRIVEAIWAIAFYLLGAPWQAVLAAWLAAFIQEYLRARAGGLGVSELLIVTWCERPVRATLIFIPLVGRLISLDLFMIAAWIWLMMQITSCIALFSSLRSQLRQSQR